MLTSLKSLDEDVRKKCIKREKGSKQLWHNVRSAFLLTLAPCSFYPLPRIVSQLDSKVILHWRGEFREGFAKSKKRGFVDEADCRLLKVDTLVERRVPWPPGILSMEVVSVDCQINPTNESRQFNFFTSWLRRIFRRNIFKGPCMCSKSDSSSTLWKCGANWSASNDSTGRSICIASSRQALRVPSSTPAFLPASTMSRMMAWNCFDQRLARQKWWILLRTTWIVQRGSRRSSPSKIGYSLSVTQWGPSEAEDRRPTFPSRIWTLNSVSQSDTKLKTSRSENIWIGALFKSNSSLFSHSVAHSLKGAAGNPARFASATTRSMRRKRWGITARLVLDSAVSVTKGKRERGRER